MNDPHFTKAITFLSSYLSPLANINRRVVQLNSGENFLVQDLFPYDDIGNIDFTGMEPKNNKKKSESIWDLDFSKQSRFPHFPVSSRRQEGQGKLSDSKK